MLSGIFEGDWKPGSKIPKSTEVLKVCSPVEWGIVFTTCLVCYLILVPINLNILLNFTFSAPIFFVKMAILAPDYIQHSAL